MHLIRALSVHFGLLIIKAEIDQLKEGLLKGMQLLVKLQKHPELFAPVFTCAGEKPLTAGNLYVCTLYQYAVPVVSVMYFRINFETIYHQMFQQQGK